MKMMNIKKIRQTHNLNAYSLLWIISLAIIIYLAQHWYINKQFIGIVERKTHQLGAQESGRINTMLVNVGDAVKRDQILVIFDISDLKTSLEQLRQELANFQKLKRAQHDRYSILVQRMALELENEAANLVERMSIIQSKNTELAGLNAEINRLKQAEKAGLGHSRDLAEMILQRDALASYLEEQSKELALQSQKLEKARQSRNLLTEANIDSMTESFLIDQMEYSESLRRQVAETEHRVNLRSVFSPCDGYITEILARTGDVVDAFIPVLTIEELKPSYLDVYVPEHCNLCLEPGLKTEIYSSRNSDFNTSGLITFVHPGFTRAADRLSFRGQIFWARKVRVELPETHNLIPGEVVNVRILKKNSDLKLSSFSLLASELNQSDMNNSTKKKPLLTRMEIDASLLKKTRFEPSGVAWLPDIKKYIIVSDDTGIKDTRNDHAPYLFFMNSEGKVDADPVILPDLNTVNDLEAVAQANNNTLYLVSSQNISKKNKRPVNREMIIKLKQEGEKLTIVNKVHFLSLLLRSYSNQKLTSLGLEKFEADKRPELNIEGAAYYDNALYFGLKEPVSEKGAIIWKLDNVDNIFNIDKLSQDQLSVYGYVKLGEYKNRLPSISDLMFDSNGVLWALSTIANAKNEDQLGGLHRINRFADGRLEAVRLLSFPKLKPEGICLQGTDRFLIVFDNDNENPVYCYFDTE